MRCHGTQCPRNTCGSGKQRAPCHRSRSLPSRHLNMVPRIRIRRQGSSQASAEHFQQCAEFLPLRNRGFGSLAVSVLAIAVARRAAATACAAVQPTAPLFRRSIRAPSFNKKSIVPVIERPSRLSSLLRAGTRCAILAAVSWTCLLVPVPRTNAARHFSVCQAVSAYSI